MNNWTIDFLVKGIEAKEAVIKAALKEMDGTPDDRVKINRLINLLAEASEELAYLREAMLIHKQPTRKFALLCKPQST